MCVVSTIITYVPDQASSANLLAAGFLLFLHKAILTSAHTDEKGLYFKRLIG